VKTRDLVYAWCNLTESPVHFIVVFTPGHIEGLFRAVAAKKVDDVEEFARSYGTRIVGPVLNPGFNHFFHPGMTEKTRTWRLQLPQAAPVATTTTVETAFATSTSGRTPVASGP
jgi:hypothetical protein